MRNNKYYYTLAPQCQTSFNTLGDIFECGVKKVFSTAKAGKRYIIDCLKEALIDGKIHCFIDTSKLRNAVPQFVAAFDIYETPSQVAYVIYLSRNEFDG